MSKLNTPNKVDPGWNDPPLLNYSSSNPPPKSRIGNKRVAFPLSSKEASDNKPQSPLTSIPVSATPPSILSQMAPPTALSSESTSSENSDNEQLRNETMANFHKVIDTVKSCNIDEIKKSLELMENSWQENKLSNVMQSNLSEIPKALLAGDTQKALNHQAQIVMENALICREWATGLRHLIQNVEK